MTDAGVKESPPPAMVDGDEIDLVAVFAILWRKRWWIVGITALFLLLASLYLRFATYRYTATLTLMPAQSGSSSLGKLGGLSGMASLAGVSLPQDSGMLSMSLFTEGLHSRELADAVAKHPGIMHGLFRHEWNSETKTWQDPALGHFSLSRLAKDVLGVPVYPWTAPDGARLQEVLSKRLQVNTDKDTSFVTLGFDDRDPAFATHLVDTAAAEMNRLIKEQALERSTENIAYLSEQLQKTTLLEQRLAIIQTLGEQERKRMSANSSAPYAADPIGTAAASRRPTSPRPLLVLVGAFFAGSLAGITFTLILAKVEETRRCAKEEAA